MSNCYHYIFCSNPRVSHLGLLAIFAAVCVLAFVENANGEQPSPSGSSRKKNASTMDSRSTRPTSKIQHAVASTDESADVVSQVSCKNCQENSGVAVAHNHAATAPTEPEEAFNSNANYDDTNCEVACMPQGISLRGGCDDACGLDPCSPLGLLSRRLYMRAEVASFWGSGQFLPTLVTTSVGDPLPAVDQAGLIGNANTRSLFGGREVVAGGSAGIRYEVGLWMDESESRGFLVRFLDSGEKDVNLQTDGTRQAVIARNFLDVGPPREQSVVSIAYPNQTSGSISANLSTNTRAGDLLLRQVLCQDHLVRCDWLMGYQTARLSESLDIVTNTTNLSAPNPILDQEDHFRIRSQFHGATFGVGGEAREGNWFFGGLFKLGLGNMERRIDISGLSRTTVGADVSTQNQGLLARQTNIGTYRRETFVMVPELGLHVGYRLTHQLDLTLGYSMLRLPKVGRVSDTLDRELASNVSNPLVGEVRPIFTMPESNFTLHSLNLGLQWAY